MWSFINDQLPLINHTKNGLKAATIRGMLEDLHWGLFCKHPTQATFLFVYLLDSGGAQVGTTLVPEASEKSLKPILRMKQIDK